MGFRAVADRIGPRRRWGVPLVAALACLLLVLLDGGPAMASRSSRAVTPDQYTPQTGALFNNPLGTSAQQRVLMTDLIRTINSTPPRSTIRVAMFSFADSATSRALIAAYHRGVRVKMVIAGGRTFPPVRRLRQVLGHNVHKRSYLAYCSASCRGTKGSMHAKFFQFSTAGAVHNVTMVGSENLTRHNAEDQWSDLYTVAGDRAYFLAFRRWFAQLRLDVPRAHTYLHSIVGLNDVAITPINLSRVTDPISRTLNKIVCQTPLGQIDPTASDPETLVPTQVMLASHAWNGERGKDLARQVAELSREGCQVRLFYGVGMGGAVKVILERNGVTLSSGTHPGIYTHQKLMIIDGNYAGNPDTIHVLTGSQNWSSRAAQRDDIIVQTDDQAVGQQYVDAYEFMWANG